MSLNKVILIGNVGKDPDVRYYDNGGAYANFPLATSDRGYTLANGTVVPERTEWHNVVVRREQVAFVEKWVRKGSGVYVEGKIRTRTYDDQNGIKRYVTEIYADRIDFFSFGKREEGQTASTPSSQPASSFVQPAASATTASPSSSVTAETGDFSEKSGEADDLPF
ncbi:MAG: single-stranded DNA-binding protein [Tannerellaceae bacterium]|jgi:single-strand DNA-binding protein|nr:single-stranded DNA-binding protein [Tannerellaceae bacterium]